jgi:hypothetical protein
LSENTEIGNRFSHKLKELLVAIKNAQLRKMKRILFTISIFFFDTMIHGQTDRDIDNDGQWDYECGGTDRDLDSDGQWAVDRGGIDRDLDNDGEWGR